MRVTHWLSWFRSQALQAPKVIRAVRRSRQSWRKIEALERRLVLTSPAATIELATAPNLNVLYGADEYDYFGNSVSRAGDVNGDGYQDVIIGARYGTNDELNQNRAGKSYVVFGGPEPIGAGDIAARSNVTIVGDGDHTYGGWSVTGGGDFNGDGFDDLLIGAPGGFDAGLPQPRIGKCFVVFGSNTLPSRIDLANLGKAGITITPAAFNDYCGLAVSFAGDTNGDGFDDLLVGAPGTPASENSLQYSGRSYLILGRRSSPATIDLGHLGSNGTKFIGANSYDEAGRALSAAGDVNRDGFADFLIGALYATPQSSSVTAFGATYLIYGAASLPREVELGNLGSRGVTIFGADSGDYAGCSVSGAGDVNGDGFEDLLIGARAADSVDNSREYAGESYLVFGNDDLPSTIQLAQLGSLGVTLFGRMQQSLSGNSLGIADDLDGDGFDDLLIGAYQTPIADVSGPSTVRVLFGRSQWPQTIDFKDDVDSLLTFTELNGDDLLGSSVAGVGDMNGDGLGDFIMGAPQADGRTNATESSGEVYVVYGSNFRNLKSQIGTPSMDRLESTPEVARLIGGRGADTLLGTGPDDVLLGGAGPDRVVIRSNEFRRLDGGSGSNTLVVDAAGVVLDLTTLPDSDLTNFSVIDIRSPSTGSAFNTLTLDVQEVRQLNHRGQTVRVLATPGHDVVQVGDGWVLVRSEWLRDGVPFNVYANGTTSLLVQTRDTTRPSLTITGFDGSEGTTHVGVVTFKFSEPVSGFNMSDLSLTCDGSDVSLDGLSLLGSRDTYTIDLSSVTRRAGFYSFGFRDQATGIVDAAGLALLPQFARYWHRPAPRATWSIDREALLEGQSATLSVTLDLPTDETLTYQFQSSDNYSFSTYDPVTGNFEYRRPVFSVEFSNDGEIVIPAGGMTGTLEIRLPQDSLDKDNRNISIQLANNPQISLTPWYLSLDLLDDDAGGIDARLTDGQIQIRSTRNVAPDVSVRLNEPQTHYVVSSSTHEGSNQFSFAVEDVTDGILVLLGETNDRFDATGIRLPVTVFGGDGDDTIFGGSGNDSLFGLAGADSINGNEGDDFVHGALATFAFYWDEDSSYSTYRDEIWSYHTSNSEDAADILSGGDGNDSLFGNRGNDTLNGDNGNDLISGGGGSDRIDGGPGADELNGAGSAQDFVSEVHYDSSDEDDSNDLISGGPGSDSLFGFAGDDTLRGLAGDDSLSGGDGNDLLDGGTGNDQLFGNAGNDVLKGQQGIDTLRGSDGVDTLNGGDAVSSIDDDFVGQLLLTDSGYLTERGDRVIVQGFEAATLIGSDAPDFVDSRAVTRGVIKVRTGSGNDTLIGGNSQEVFYGDDGDDVLIGAGGDDCLQGCNGNDTLRGATGVDSLGGGLGNDVLDAGIGSNHLAEFSSSNVTVTTDRITGATQLTGLGTDTLSGRWDNVELYGADYFDLTFTRPTFEPSNRWGYRYLGLRTSLVPPTDSRGVKFDVRNFDGPATLIGTSRGDLLLGSSFNDSVNGAEGNDTLFGYGGNDVLLGDSGDDQLNGGLGKDTLTGSWGFDVLNGGVDFDRVIETRLYDVNVVGTFMSSSWSDTDSLQAIEELHLIGGPESTRFDARHSALPVLMIGNGGDDTLLGGAFNDTIKGGDGNDVLSGGAGNDELLGQGGNDVQFEFGDFDIAVIGAKAVAQALGRDRTVSIEGVVLLGGEKANKFDASAATVSVTLLGAAGNDTLIGGSQSDLLIGGDRIDPATGIDSLIGGDGEDIFDNDDQDSHESPSEVAILDVLQSLPNWIDSI